jgi:hypothetical protein
MRRGFAAGASLALVGIIAGWLIAVGTLAVLSLIIDGWGGFPFVWDAFTFAGAIGAVLGGVLTPLTGLTILRHVPLGRIVAVTGAGTVIGASVGLLIPDNFLWYFVGPIIGYLAAANWLGKKYRAPRVPARRSP